MSGIAGRATARWIQLVHVDTDEEDQIRGELVHSETLKNEWVNGQGCGGDAILGENAIRSSVARIRGAIANSDLLLVIACLGRGTGSGGVQAVSRLVKEENILTFFFVTLPFAFEGNNKQHVADKSLKELRGGADVVIAVQNDLLFRAFPADTQASETFKYANQILADGVIGIAELIRCRGLLSVDFPSLKSILSRREAFCSIGIGKAKGENKISSLIDNLFLSPMLGGKDFVDKADVIIATLIGGDDMSIGEMQKCLVELNNQLNPATKTIIGANVVSDKGEEIQISMLVIQFPRNNTKIRIEGHSPNKRKSVVKKKAGRNLSETVSPYQLTLPFGDEGHTLGLFANSPATVYQGQNLDIPTFQRLGINLNLEED